jgi:uncharacterized protein (UPF0261 family)
MNKLNGFEAWFLKEAIKHFTEVAEKEVEEAQSKPKRGMTMLYAPGYFKMIGKDLTKKVDDLTKKKRGRKPKN